MPVRNEAWVLGLSTRVALMWLDELVVLNHASCDRSVDILADIQREHPGRVHLVSVHETTWDEMQHRQFMLELARAKGATHIAIVDADEILTANLVKQVKQWVEMLAGGACLHLPGYNLRGGLNRYHSNGIWGRRWFSTAFRDDPRLHWSGDKFHSREPLGMRLNPTRFIEQGQGGVMHLWGVTERRLRAKSALYKVTERVRWPDKPVATIEEMYNWAIKGQEGHPSYGTPATWTYADVPESWWKPYHKLPYVEHGEPWQEAEVRRLLQVHGREHFRGLDLFGVDDDISAKGA